jgi:DGQHR domain-containing protein
METTPKGGATTDNQTTNLKGNNIMARTISTEARTEAVSELLPQTAEGATETEALVGIVNESLDAEADTKPTTARRGRKTAAPKVDPMFSDNAEEAVDTEGLPEPELEEGDINLVENKPTPKERRMQIQAHFVPGKSALVTMTPDALKELAFISTYNTVDEQSSSPRQHGYQRDPLDARFPAIGRYFSQEEGEGGKHTHAHLITPIIASVRVYSPKDQAEFNHLFSKGDIAAIHAKFGKSVVSIVDGQHRMGGLFWAWENKANFNPDVPLMFYYGLRYADEATLFDDINTNQRKLPKALIEATKVHMEAGEKTHQQTIREAAFSLAQDGDSPWFGMVNMTGARDPEKPVTYEGLRRATGNMLHEKLVARLERQGLVLDKVAKKYWELVSRACAPAWQDRPKLVKTPEGETEEVEVKYRLKDLAGVASVSRLGADILGSALDQSRTEEEFMSAVASMVSKLGQVDWEKRPGNPWTSAGAGFAGQTGLYKMLYELIYLDQAPGVSVASNGEEATEE